MTERTEEPAQSRDPAADRRPEPDAEDFDLQTLIDLTIAPLDRPDRVDEFDEADDDDSSDVSATDESETEESTDRDQLPAWLTGAPDIPPRSRRDLEWSKLLEILGEYAVTPEGEEIVGNLPELPDSGAVTRRLHEVGEAMRMLEEYERPPIGGLRDIRKAIAHVRKQGTLVAEDLEAVGRNCDVATRVASFFKGQDDEFPYLSAIGRQVAPCEECRKALDHAIEPGGRLSDQASPDIGRLRQRVQNQHDRLKAKIDDLLRSRQLEEHLQDDYYTIRENRYVLPVRVGSKSAVPGIVHGYSSSGQTAFIEPEALVDINNELRWAEIELQEEKQRILDRLSRLVADHADALSRNIELLTYLDVVVASAEFGLDSLDGSIPTVTDGEMQINDIRHPLLWVQNQRKTNNGETVNDTVTNDVRIDRDKQVLVVSGPNTGGKTVLLKAMGLCALMTRCGLPIPAGPDSRLPLHDAIYTDIGDEQSIERDLSTFSAHLTNINQFLDGCGPNTFVLLDELFTGTDPLEGSALAVALLEELAERGATTVVTTHLEGLKTLALQSDEFANASMGFDLEELEPTYDLTMGIPGSSFAIRIANRLGFPQRLVDRASEVLEGEEHKELDEVLSSLEEQMDDVRREKERLESDRERAQRAERKYKKKFEDLKDREREMVHDETQELKEELRDARETIRTAIREISQRGRIEDFDQAELNDMQDELDEAEETIQQAGDQTKPPEPGPDGLIRVQPDEIREGMDVYSHEYQREGTLVDWREDEQTALIQFGALKVSVDEDDIFYPSEEARRKHLGGGSSGQSSDSGSRTTGSGAGRRNTDIDSIPRTDNSTLDLRGLRAEEARDRLDRYLDDKFLDGFGGVYVIHGHGTGALRRAVRGYLTESPYVDEFRRGDESEGGDGVTVVKLTDEIDRS